MITNDKKKVSSYLTKTNANWIEKQSKKSKTSQSKFVNELVTTTRKQNRSFVAPATTMTKKTK